MAVAHRADLRGAPDRQAAGATGEPGRRRARLAHHAHRSVDHRDARRRPHRSPRSVWAARTRRRCWPASPPQMNDAAAGPSPRSGEPTGRVTSSSWPPGSDARIRQPRRRWPRHRGHHHRRADHVRARRRGDERCVTANCVAPRAFSLSRHAPTPPPTRRAGSPRASPISSAARPTPRPAGRRSDWRRLPTDADLNAAGPPRSLAYDRAWWFSRFVAETYGTDDAAGAVPARLRTRPSRRCHRRARHARRGPADGRSLGGGSGCPASLTGDEPGPAGYQ